MNNTDYIEVTIDLTKEEEQLVRNFAKKKKQSVEEFINLTVKEFVNKLKEEEKEGK